MLDNVQGYCKESPETRAILANHYLDHDDDIKWAMIVSSAVLQKVAALRTINQVAVICAKTVNEAMTMIPWDLMRTERQ